MDKRTEGYDRVNSEEFFNVLKNLILKNPGENKMAYIKDFVFLKGHVFLQVSNILYPLYEDVQKSNKKVIASYIERHVGDWYEKYLTGDGNDVQWKPHADSIESKTALKQAKTICKMAKKMYAKEIKQVKREFKKEMRELGQENC